MDWKKWKQRKRIALIAAIACCIATAAGGSLAYFAAQETSYNVITTAALDMTLHEETADGSPFPMDGVMDVLPDSHVDKIVYAENSGEAEFWCRICVDKSIQAADGVDAELNFDHIALDINTDAWTERDGYYYYDAPVRSGECTQPLFTQVRFGRELGNAYADAKLAVRVRAQAVQSKNNGASALDAAGWPEADEG